MGGKMVRGDFRLFLFLGLCAGFMQFAFAGAAEEETVRNLLNKMTMDEKIGQLGQLHPGALDNDFEQLSTVIRSGGVGSFLNAGGRENKHRLQRVAVEESRLGIPLIFGRDVIHGYRTVFPIPLAQAASWNPELVENAAAISAREAAQEGIHWTFAPMLDIARDPRWGRIAESPGEDPYLAAIMAAAMVHGYQGDDISNAHSIAACAKHFVGYGAAEGGRDYNTTFIPENELRNIYLPSFKAAVDANVATVMSAFNDLNGIPASGNIFTLRQVLRNEWQFDGFVVSDWTSMIEMVDHGYCTDEKDAARKSIIAGVDMEMVSESYRDHLGELIQTGEIESRLLDEAVTNILRIKYRLGIFEKPYGEPAVEDVMLHPDHLQTARELAAQSMVLLKNENGILPIDGTTVGSLAVIGPLADSPLDQMGTWTPDGLPDDVITPLRALMDDDNGLQIDYAPGLVNPRSVERDLFDEAVDAARNADLAVVFLGEDYLLSGEAHSRAFLNLPGAQEELLQVVAETGTPVALVILAGRPLTFSNIAGDAEAILYAWHPGTMGGPAVCDLLLGAAIPSGKLPVSFPRTVGQIPIYYNHRNTGRPPTAELLGLELGCPTMPLEFLSYYLDADYTPQYPFGFGLSYAEFDYSDLTLSPDHYSGEDEVMVQVQVTNSGTITATEVVQLYIRDVTASITRPVKELKGFQRVSIQPGETRPVQFVLDSEDLAFWNADMQFVAEPGQFEVMVGSSSSDSDLVRAPLELTAHP